MPGCGGCDDVANAWLWIAAMAYGALLSVTVLLSEC